MRTLAFPLGTAAASDFGHPKGKPIIQRIEQQAVTPIDQDRSRYLYATGVEATWSDPRFLDSFFNVVNAAFAEDKAIIEAQFRTWKITPPDRKMAFISQDKAPFHVSAAHRSAAE